MELKDYIENINNYLKVGDIENALIFAVDEFPLGYNQDTLDSIILLQSKYAKIRREITLGIISRSDMDIEVSKIIVGVQDICKQVSSRKSETKSKKNTLISKSVKIFIFPALFLAAVIFLLYLYFYDKPFTFTVVTSAEKGGYKPIFDLNKKRKVIIDFGNDRKQELINDKGVAIFNGIPSNYKGEKVKINIAFENESEQPYENIDSDSLYLLNENGIVYLNVKLKNCDILHGRIFDHTNGDPLEKVRVAIQDLFTLTDKNGWFELLIPEEKQQKFQQVILTKDSFQTETFDSVPIHTKQEFRYGLKRKY